MAFFTKEEARSAARTRTVISSERLLDEAVAATSDTQMFDIFLSHASKDAELVLGIKTLLEQQGLDVYVDWVVDTQLDLSSVSKSTAQLLRKRMAQSNSLIYMATASASNSKWMPWELGYFDGLRKRNVAILPLMDRPTDVFAGQEYLGLYPLVIKGVLDVYVEEAGRPRATLQKFAKSSTNSTIFG